MKIFFFILAGILVLGVLVLPIILVFVSQSADSWLINVRDMSLIYSSLFMCVGAILFIIATGLLAMIAFLIRDHIVPAIDKLNDTAKTVRGTATFVSESVVAPIIKVAGAASGVKAAVQTLMRRKTPKP
ncbi:MAG TPA: hypothetical protein VJ183_05405 [Chloroflexia bacterium]|nr:hypothetical protein [Chloroflexia bacterium]